MSITEFLLARIAEGIRRVRAPYLRSPIGKTAMHHRYVEAAWAELVALQDAELVAYRHRLSGGREDEVRALAAVYADHPDYDERWRP